MLHSERSGQVSIEFMAYFGILLSIFVAFSPVIFNQAVEIRKRSAAIKAARIGASIEKEINTAVRFGDGYSRNFTLPDKISKSDYSLQINSSEHGNFLSLKWNEGVETRQLIASEIQGEPIKGKNLIKNSDGIIYFE